MMTNIASMSDNKLRFDRFSEPFKEYKLGDITETISRPIKMSDEKEYLLVTVKRRNEGIVERGIYKGKEIKVKSQFEVATGDFLISKRQIIHGACEIVPINMSGAIVSNEYHILHGKQDLLLTEYLNLLSKTPKLKNYFALSCVGVDIEKMLFRIEDWKKRVVKIPSIEEQREVVSFFDIFNRKLEKQRGKIKQLEQFKKGMMQKIFSQELQFRDEDGGEFGEWENYKLEKLLTRISPGATPSTLEPSYWGGEIPWASSGEINLRNIYDVEKRITSLGFKNSSTSIIPRGSVLIALAGQGKTRGKVAINHIELTTNQSLAAMIPNDLLLVQYLFFDLEYRYEELRNLSAGDGGRGGLNLKLLKNLKMEVPSVKEQEKISYFLLMLDTKIEKEKEKLMILEEQKRGFMQGMFV